MNKPFEDFVDRDRVPRMPWHDIASRVSGDSAKDVARHFIQRWNFTKMEKAKDRNDYPLLVPKAYGAQGEEGRRRKTMGSRTTTRTTTTRTTTTRTTLGTNDEISVAEEEAEEPQLEEEEPSPLSLLAMEGAFRTKTQVLRSVSHWSAGNKKPEASIQRGWIQAIEEAQHYIYIENQFFVSCDEVHNRIGDALYRRIVKAHEDNEAARSGGGSGGEEEGRNFRVFVILPLLPAFEGDVGTESEGR